MTRDDPLAAVAVVDALHDANMDDSGESESVVFSRSLAARGYVVRRDMTCAARTANTGPNDPQDCDWPFCGCDPHAQKAIDALDECGYLLKPLRSGTPQGRCEMTMTERFANPACKCPTYAGNLGPCKTFERGAGERCVYCDHTEECHAGIGADVADIRARCEAQAARLIAECVARYGAVSFRDFDCDLVPDLTATFASALQSALAEVATLTDRIGKLETQGLMQAHENATLTAERDLAAFGNAQGHGDPCHMCGEPIDSYAGNASRWGTALPIGGGIMAWHHKGCITRALQPAAATGVSTSLLRNADEPLPPGCYCKPGKCMAPKIMGRQLQCRDPEKAAATGGEGT